MPYSKNYLRTKLDDASRRCTQNPPKGSALDVSRWSVEVRMVEEVEELRPEFEGCVLGKLKVLGRNEIDVLICRADQVVTTLISIGILRGSCKGCGIDPCISALMKVYARIGLAYYFCSLRSAPLHSRYPRRR